MTLVIPSCATMLAGAPLALITAIGVRRMRDKALWTDAAASA